MVGHPSRLQHQAECLPIEHEFEVWCFGIESCGVSQLHIYIYRLFESFVSLCRVLFSGEMHCVFVFLIMLVDIGLDRIYVIFKSF